MKKVLIISSSFPPNSSVGGIRPANFFKNFNSLGIDAHVFSIKHEKHDRLMEMDFDDSIKPKIKKMEFTKAEELSYIENRSILEKVRDFFYPTYSSPPGLLTKACDKINLYFDIESFDLIIATSPDLWTAHLASLINSKYGTEYIVDFRDAFEQEIGMPRNFRQRLQVARLLYARKKILKNATELISVSKFLVTQLEQKFKKRTLLIYNGFDEELFYPNEKGVLDRRKSSGRVLKIVYIGRILNLWYRNPEPLIRAILSFNQNSNSDIKFELHLYGTETDIFEKFESEGSDSIWFHDRIPYTQVKNVLSNADLLLVLTNLDRRGILTTKLFEYMPLGKPIICLPNNDDELSEIINQYGLGFSFKDEEEILRFFNNYYENISVFKLRQTLREKIPFFTRLNQSKILAEYIISKAL